jgi:hypothetical protein
MRFSEAAEDTLTRERCVEQLAKGVAARTASVRHCAPRRAPSLARAPMCDSEPIRRVKKIRQRKIRQQRQRLRLSALHFRPDKVTRSTRSRRSTATASQQEQERKQRTKQPSRLLLPGARFAPHAPLRLRLALGARAAPHASRRSARQAAQPPAPAPSRSRCACSAARFAPQRAPSSTAECPEIRRAR